MFKIFLRHLLLVIRIHFHYPAGKPISGHKGNKRIRIKGFRGKDACTVPGAFDFKIVAVPDSNLFNVVKKMLSNITGKNIS
jgi:hypothetical protein